jgi:hypothetical protein
MASTWLGWLFEWFHLLLIAGTLRGMSNRLGINTKTLQTIKYCGYLLIAVRPDLDWRLT